LQVKMLTMKHRLDPATTHTSANTAACCVHDGKLLLIGGYNGQKALSAVSVYDMQSEKWHDGPPMAGPRNSCGAVAVAEQVVVVGGFDGQRRLDTVERLGHDWQWTALPPMTVERSAPAVVALRGEVYVMGGKGTGQTGCNMVERFDLSKNEWLPVPPMTQARSGAGAAVLHGRIWVAGGEYDGHALSSVEAYDPETLQWNEVSALLAPRSYPAMAVLDGYLCVLGGGTSPRNQDLFLSPDSGAMERYIPSTADNIAGSWALMPSQIKKRQGACAATLNGTMYLIGGWSKPSLVSTPEVFHIETE